MASAFRKIKKLRGRSFEELRVRSGQALSCFVERYGLSARTRTSTDSEFFSLIDPSQQTFGSVTADGLLAHFRSRSTPRFFSSFDNRVETVAELKRRLPEAAAQSVQSSERIGLGRFDLLGFRDLNFGDPIDWHLEPVSLKRAPLQHWSRIDELDPTKTGDKKIVWELNRHQHFLALGRAYWCTGDERYTQMFVKQLSGWMDENPPTLGVNWISNLEVAFRLISWCWALYYFRESPILSPQFFLQTLKFLHLHAQHLEIYLSTYVSPNTHLTGEALGLFYAGTLFPELSPSKRWRDIGRSVLLTEVERHVKPDGVYFEQSTYYHRYTIDFYTHFLILAEINKDNVRGIVEPRLIGLLDHLMYITRPDGLTPRFGDDDGGRLVRFENADPNDSRATLATAAVLFNRPDYKFVSGEASEETLWLLGPEGLRHFDNLKSERPIDESRAFTDGGYYVMRDGWNRDSNYLMIDGGPHGEESCGYAHGHADALSFELAAYGRTLLVDPGTYSYIGRERDYFRSSAAHNTLTVDEESSSVPDGPFSWKSVANIETNIWFTSKHCDFFQGHHDGYLRLQNPVTHTRTVLFRKDHYWVIRDSVLTTGLHSYQLRFHFAPGANAQTFAGPFGSTILEATSTGPGLEIITAGPGGTWHQTADWVSQTYGHRTTAQTCKFTSKLEGSQEFITFLIPHRVGDQNRSTIRELESANGRLFELLNESGRDILVLPAGGRLESQLISATCNCAIIRFDQNGRVDQWLIVDGERLEIKGSVVFAAERPVRHVAARLVNGALEVETRAAENTEFNLASLGAQRIVVNEIPFDTAGADVVEVKGASVVSQHAESIEYGVVQIEN
jgi:hypothetical protein